MNSDCRCYRSREQAPLLFRLHRHLFQVAALVADVGLEVAASGLPVIGAQVTITGTAGLLSPMAV